MKISVIVTTYNRPDALSMVLDALSAQTDQQFEVIVGDDGSDERTRTLIDATEMPVPLKHVWQEDDGFRAAQIRNKAVAASTGDYLIFMDGDCLALPHFIDQHRKLAEQKWFVAGNRVLLSEEFTDRVLSEKHPIYLDSRWAFLKHKLNSRINRILPLMTLPLGRFRKLKQNTWYGVKTCNLGVWKDDFIAVNGFDESYVGWGYEDSDLVIRLLRNGVMRKQGRFVAPVLHLWHPENDRTHQEDNMQRLREIEGSGRVVAPRHHP